VHRKLALRVHDCIQYLGGTIRSRPKNKLVDYKEKIMHALSPSKRATGVTLSRRRFFHLAGGGVALPALSRFAWAQTYPSRPVRIVVPVAPGGGSDIRARLLGEYLSERLGQPFIIENRPGAGINIGTEVVVRAPPDGYTLLLVNAAHTSSATLYEKLNFTFTRDIAPVAGISREPYIMVVHPSVPAKTVPEFITYAKANPNKISMASPGIGTGGHVSGELFKMMAGVDMVHVPYRGAAPAQADLISGQVQVSFGASTSIDQFRAGTLRALAVTGVNRSETHPDIPTMGEYLPGYEASFWAGVGAPKNTPADIIEKLNKEINTALAAPMIKARLADLGGMPMPTTPAEFGKFIAEETEKWAKVIKFAGIKPV
jgi:tripartite-type tricarboxylate transporter receptor subunit TctC